MRPLTGLILCGGLSSRMGTDKGLMRSDGMPWFLLRENVFREAGFPCLISVNPLQKMAYPRVSSGLSFVADEAPEYQGPMRGLISAHRLRPDSDFFVVACDMIRFSREVLEFFLSARRQEAADFHAFRNAAGFPETGCAIYSAAGLEKNPAAASLRRLLEEGETKFLQAEEEWFPDADTPEELRSLSENR